MKQSVNFQNKNKRKTKKKKDIIEIFCFEEHSTINMKSFEKLSNINLENLIDICWVEDAQYFNSKKYIQNNESIH